MTDTLGRQGVAPPSTPGSGGAEGGGAPSGALALAEALPLVAAALAHEVRTPLNAMALQLALLAEKVGGGAGEAAAPHLQAVRKQIRRVDELVGRLVEAFAPVSAGGSVDLSALVAAAAGLLGADLRAGGVAIELDAPRPARCAASAPGLLGLLVVGLLSDAAARGRGGGALRVSVAEADGLARLTIVVRGPRAAGPGDGAPGAGAAAAELGGRLEVEQRDGELRVELRLRGGTP